VTKISNIKKKKKEERERNKSKEKISIPEICHMANWRCGNKPCG
jgi:hypothetical protein